MALRTRRRGLHMRASSKTNKKNQARPLHSSASMRLLGLHMRGLGQNRNPGGSRASGPASSPRCPPPPRRGPLRGRRRWTPARCRLATLTTGGSEAPRRGRRPRCRCDPRCSRGAGPRAHQWIGGLALQPCPRRWRSLHARASSRGQTSKALHRHGEVHQGSGKRRARRPRMLPRHRQPAKGLPSGRQVVACSRRQRRSSEVRHRAGRHTPRPLRDRLRATQRRRRRCACSCRGGGSCGCRRHGGDSGRGRCCGGRQGGCRLQRLASPRGLWPPCGHWAQ